MSAIKTYYENLTDIIAEAVYEECLDMPDYIEVDRTKLWGETFRQLIDDPRAVYSFMAEVLEHRGYSDMPLTVNALTALKSLIADTIEEI